MNYSFVMQNVEKKAIDFISCIPMCCNEGLAWHVSELTHYDSNSGLMLRDGNEPLPNQHFMLATWCFGQQGQMLYL